MNLTAKYVRQLQLKQHATPSMKLLSLTGDGSVSRQGIATGKLLPHDDIDFPTKVCFRETLLELLSYFAFDGDTRTRTLC